MFLLFLWEKPMTVSTTTNKISYIGNGVAVEFAIPFPFLETTHLKVFQLLNDVQSERTDWTIQDGNIVFADAPASGAQIVILREVPFTQETDYQENEILAAETLERNFDSLTMQVQQLKEQADRAVTVDIFDDTQTADLLPSIRTAVSDAANYAQTASNKAEIAEIKAQDAEESAQIATEKATEVSVALITKANTDLSNCTRPYVAETYRNGTEWYQVWSDGWIEQGGYLQANTDLAVLVCNFLKPFTSMNYIVLRNVNWSGQTAYPNVNYGVNGANKNTVSSFSYTTVSWADSMWYACGY